VLGRVDSETFRELSFCAGAVSSVSLFEKPAWRNWQTRWTQNPVLARVCGFEPLRRQSLYNGVLRGKIDQELLRTPCARSRTKTHRITFYLSTSVQQKKRRRSTPYVRGSKRMDYRSICPVLPSRRASTLSSFSRSSRRKSRATAHRPHRRCYRLGFEY
jgi:hypothetical protein